MTKVMISLPDELLEKVDRYANNKGRSRNEVVREALRILLSGRGMAGNSWEAAIASLKELETQWVGQWDSTDVIRYSREIRDGRQDRH